MLTLPIKRIWFDRIVSGEKREEYRKICHYYEVRFANAMPNAANLRTMGFDPIYKIKLRAGYRSDSPSCVISCRIDKGLGKVEWGAEPRKHYFRLKIIAVSDHTMVPAGVQQ